MFTLLLRLVRPVLLAGTLLATISGYPSPHHGRESACAPGAIHETQTRAPFVENRGQIRDSHGNDRPDIKFIAPRPDFTAYFRDDGVSYVFIHDTVDVRGLHAPDETHMWASSATPSPTTSVRSAYRLDLAFRGARRCALVGESPRSEYANYYNERHPEGITHVATFGAVAYKELYPNIDLVFLESGDHLKYQFELHPGARVSDIQLEYRASSGLRSTSHGEVEVACALGTLREQRPKTYQPGSNLYQIIPSSFIVHDSVLTFAVGAYDSTSLLIIDPDLVWATYLGGSSSDAAFWGSVDAQDNMIVGGLTNSVDFPVTAGAAQPINGGDVDMFIAKFDSTGKRLWVTYYGGPYDEHCYCVKPDKLGNFWVAGDSFGDGFPVSPTAIQNTFSGGTGDVTLVKLAPDGTRLYASYYGGYSYDYSDNLVIDNQNGVWFTGATLSGNFPVTVSGQAGTYHGGFDAFLLHVDSLGRRISSRYFGGSGDDIGKAVDIDGAGNLLLFVTSGSSDMPTVGAPFQPSRSGGLDGYLTKLNGAGIQQWYTYLGGSNDEFAKGICCDSAGNVYCTGWTRSTNFPTTVNAFQPSSAGQADAFVAKFSSGGKRLWATYVGGANDDYGRGVVASPCGEIVVMGSTQSSGFPVSADAWQKTFGGNEDVWLYQFDTSGNRIWGSFYGGSDFEFPAPGGGLSNEHGYGSVTVDKTCAIIVAGDTQSSNLPTTSDAAQPRSGGGRDAFVAKFYPCHTSVHISGAPTALCAGDSALLDAGADYVQYRWSTGASTRYLSVNDTGTYSVTVKDAMGCIGTSSIAIATVYPLPVPVITATGSLLLCAGDSVKLSVSGKYAGYRWSTGDTTPSIFVNSAGTYTLIVTDTHGCQGRSNAITVNVRPRLNPNIIGPQQVCPGSTTTYSTDDSTTRTFLWSVTGGVIISGQGTSRITVKWGATGSGSIRITVTDATTTCTGLFVMPVVIQTTIVPGVAIAGDTLLCAGDTLSLKADAGFSTYLWSTGDSTQAIHITQAGTYFVSVRDTSNGCNGVSAAIRVSLRAHPHPVITLAGSLTPCEGDTIRLAVPAGYSMYLWSTGERTSSITVTTSGTYFVSVDSGGCPGRSDSVVVQVHAAPKPALALVGGVICAGDTGTITAPPGYVSYHWSTGDTTRAARAWTSGTISLTVVDSFGCSGSALFTVNIHPRPTPVILATGSALCPDDSLVLMSDQPYASYSWSTGDTTRSIGVRNQGVYGLVVTDSMGCAGAALPMRIVARNIVLSIDSLPGSRLDLDTMIVGGKRCRNITVSNTGTDTAYIRDLALVIGSQFTVPTSTPPLAIAPGERRTLYVCFTPHEAGDHVDSMQFNDTCALFRIALHGYAIISLDSGPCALPVKIIGRMVASRPYPNPASNIISVPITIMRTGAADDRIPHAALYDILGNLVDNASYVVESRSTSGNAIRESGAIRFNVASVPQGMYSLSVRDGTTLARFPVAVIH